MRDRIGQQLIIGLKGIELGKDEAQFIVENSVGGIILFDRNIESIEQTHKLISDIQKLRYKTPEQVPFFISIDMEGGRVQRLKDPYTIWPPVAKLGEANSSALCFQFTQMMGKELKAIGMNLDYAPCVDIFMNPENKVIGDRALSSDPEAVARLSSAMVRGYIKSNVVACAKHFPGHGYTSVDSHFDLPVDKRNLKELEDQGDLEPFKKVIKARIDMIMTAHIQYPNIDPNWPVTLSPLFVKHFLRDALRYKGIIITDDLDMKALTKHHPIEEIPVQALKAGATMLLYCNEPKSPIKAVKRLARAMADDEVSKETVESNYKIITDIKKKRLEQPIEPFSLDKVKQIIGCEEHKQFAKDVASGNVDKYLEKPDQ